MSGTTRRLTIVFLAWTYAVTLARGLCPPNDFAEAHWLGDYRFGLIKRGLAGSLASLAAGMSGGALTPLVIAVVSGLILAVACAVLWIIVRRAWQVAPGDPATGTLVALVVLASPFTVMTAHLWGYFDALLFVATVAAIVLVRRGRPLVAGAVQVAAVLVHESQLLVGWPLVCLAAWCAGAPGGLLRRQLVGLAMPVLVGAVLFVTHALMPGPALRAQLAAHLDAAGFVGSIGPLVALYQTTGFLDFFAQNRGAFLVRLLDARVLLSVGPTLLVCVLWLHAAYGLRALSRGSLVVLAATFMPLVMHAVAWDTERITTLAIGNALVAGWVLATRPATAAWPAVSSRVYDAVVLVAVPALLLNLFYRIPLMLGMAERFGLVERAVLYLPALALAAWALWRRGRDTFNAPAA